MTVVSLALAVILPLASAGCEPHTSGGDPLGRPGDFLLDPSVTVVDGEDYALPDWVEPEAFSGFVGHPDKAGAAPFLQNKNWWTSWAELEPTRGEYNWALVDQMLGEATAMDYRLIMHLRSIVVGGGDPERGIIITSAVPDWVFTEFELTDDDLVNLGWEFDLLCIPGWRRDIRDAFNELIAAFGERGYPLSDYLGSAYVHGISPSRGEEFWLYQSHIDEMERNHGFSAFVLEEWIEDRMDAYAAAFAGATHKLAWVGKVGAWKYCNPEYSDLAWRLVEFAWNLGMGNRSSAVERYHLWLDEPALGATVDDLGYLHVDESIPPIATIRYFGDENEEYGPDWEWRFGDLAGEPLRYRLSMLRALQMRMRFLWSSSAADGINRPLATYVSQSLGKTVSDSPDAWVYLKESPVGGFVTPAEVVRNFERWLRQRDLPGGQTVPTERVDREFNAGGISDDETWAFYDHIARRTDVASSNPYMYFDLDDRFAVTGPVEIKVEIRDDSPATWRVDYTDGAAGRISSPRFHGRNDGEVRTVTFALENARFTNDLDHDMDFRLVCEGPGDVRVRWVRLVRITQP